MTAADAVSYARTTTGTQGSSADAAGGFQAADFMTLLIAQLQNQDPMEPLGPSEFMAQLAQLQSVTQLSALNDTMRGLAQNQAMAGPASLLGREVTWRDATGERQGVVSELRLQGETLQPVVEGQVIPWNLISAVR